MKRLLFFLLFLFASVHFFNFSSNITFTCDPTPIERDASSYGDDVSDRTTYVRSETYERFDRDQARESAIESRQEEYNNRSRDYDQPGCSSVPTSNEPQKESPVLQAQNQVIELRGNGQYGIIEIPKAVALSLSGKRLLEEFRFNFLLHYPAENYLSNQQKSLHGWIVQTVNLLAEMYKGPNNFILRLVIKELTIMVAAAHDLLVHGEVRKAEDLIKIANIALRKFEEYRKIVYTAQLNHGARYVRRPWKIITDPAEGFAYACLLLGKTMVETGRLTFSSDARTDLYHYMTSLPHRAVDLASEIYHMSADEWDEAAKKSCLILGEVSVDLVLNAVLAKSLSSVFMPLENVSSISYYHNQEILKKTKHSAQHINMVFDHAKQAYVMEEFLAPLTVANTQEMIKKGLLYDPAMVGKYYQISSTPTTVATASATGEATVTTVATQVQKIADVVQNQNSTTGPQQNVSVEQPTVSNSSQSNSGATPLDASEIELFDYPVLPDTGLVIDGRYYTKHALERMAPPTPQVLAELEFKAKMQAIQDGALTPEKPDPRNIIPSVVEHTIESGTRKLGKNPGTIEYTSENLFVVVNLNGDVMTVIPKKNKN